MKSILRMDSLHPVGSASIWGEEESELRDGEGDVDELGVDERDPLALAFLIVSSISLSSYRTQMEPFSPIR